MKFVTLLQQLRPGAKLEFKLRGDWWKSYTSSTLEVSFFSLFQSHLYDMYFLIYENGCAFPYYLITIIKTKLQSIKAENFFFNFKAPSSSLLASPLNRKTSWKLSQCKSVKAYKELIKFGRWLAGYNWNIYVEKKIKNISLIFVNENW